MQRRRAKKPTYHQMFDWLAAKYGYEYMLALRREDPREQAAAVAKAFQEAEREEQAHG